MHSGLSHGQQSLYSYSFTRSPSSALLPFFGGRVPLLKQTTEKKGYHYSNLSTGGPSLGNTGISYIMLTTSGCSFRDTSQQSANPWENGWFLKRTIDEVSEKPEKRGPEISKRVFSGEAKAFGWR